MESFPTTPAGYRMLLDWLSSFGTVERVGIEGTGSFDGARGGLHGAGWCDVQGRGQPDHCRHDPAGRRRHGADPRSSPSPLLRRAVRWGRVGEHRSRISRHRDRDQYDDRLIRVVPAAAPYTLGRSPCWTGWVSGAGRGSVLVRSRRRARPSGAPPGTTSGHTSRGLRWLPGGSTLSATTANSLAGPRTAAIAIARLQAVGVGQPGEEATTRMPTMTATPMRCHQALKSDSTTELQSQCPHQGSNLGRPPCKGGARSAELYGHVVRRRWDSNPRGAAGPAPLPTALP